MNSRKKVLKAVFDLMMSRGEDDLSVNDMLKELNMTKGGFYHYFKSRDQLITEMLEECMLDALKEALMDARSRDDGSLSVKEALKMYFCLLPGPCETEESINVRNYFFLLFELLGKYPQLKDRYKAYYTEHFGIVKSTVDRGIKEGNLIKCANDAGCAEMIMSARNGILALNIIYKNEDLENRLEKTFETIWNEITCRGEINDRLAEDRN